jgi:hypothetical protein
MAKFIMQILVEDVEANDQDDAAAYMIKHLQKSDHIEINLFSGEDDNEHLATHLVVVGNSPDGANTLH